MIAPLRFVIPPFEPHPLLRNRHAQTLAGTYLRGRQFPYRAVAHHVKLADGDQVVLHDDIAPDWQTGGPVALLLHGLAGCFESGYMVRIAGKLNEAGVRTFRMDLRGCGAAIGLASSPYHAGRSEDAHAALERVGTLCPGSPVTLVGFSLSGNIVLKLLGEYSESLPSNLERAAVVSPAIDLAVCARSLVGPFQRFYDRHFVRLLREQVHSNCRLRSDLPQLQNGRRLKAIYEFDDAYTGPVCGYGSADRYYSVNSAAPLVERIRVPTFILAAGDDPLVPSHCFDALRLPDHVRLHMTEHGGHLGYISKPNTDPDQRWMDWRIVDWATAPLTQRFDPQISISAAADA